MADNPTQPSQPRERLLRTASELFYREGIHAVGVDRIVAEADVTRATMYRHFDGKEGLVVAYLDQEDRVLRGYADSAAAEATTPLDLVRLVIEGIAVDTRRYHNRGCPFINAAAEFPNPDSPVRQAVDRHRSWFRNALRSIVEDAGIVNAGDVAASLVLLRDAALVGAYLDPSQPVIDTFTRTARAVAGLADEGSKSQTSSRPRPGSDTPDQRNSDPSET